MFRHKHHHKERKFVVFFVLAIFLLASIVIISLTDLEDVPVLEFLHNNKPFNPPEVKAKSVYVYDSSLNKTLYSKDSNTPMQLASLTKIMTAIVAHEELSKFIDVTIRDEAIIPPDYLQYSYGEKWSRDELIRFMLFVSSNTAANSLNLEAISQGKGLIFLMNKKAEDLNLGTLSFSNPSGLDGEGEPGSYGSAKDIVKLFEYATETYPYIFESTRYKEYNFISVSGNNYAAGNTNEIADKIPGLYASKTGFTNLAGGNLIVAFEINNHKIIIVVLGSDKESRFTDMQALIAETINVLK